MRRFTFLVCCDKIEDSDYCVFGEKKIYHKQIGSRVHDVSARPLQDRVPTCHKHVKAPRFYSTEAGSHSHSTMRPGSGCGRWRLALSAFNTIRPSHFTLQTPRILQTASAQRGFRLGPVKSAQAGLPDLASPLSLFARRTLRTATAGGRSQVRLPNSASGYAPYDEERLQQMKIRCGEQAASMSSRWERMRLAWQVTGNMDTISVSNGSAADAAGALRSEPADAFGASGTGARRSVTVQSSGSSADSGAASSAHKSDAKAHLSGLATGVVCDVTTDSALVAPLRLNAADLSAAEIATLAEELQARRAGRRIRRPRVRFESIRSTLVNNPQANFSFTNRIPLAHLQEIMVDVWHETGLA